MTLAAELHEVGKLAIPDSILRKPGPLSGEEWQFVRRHPLIGERILSSAPALAKVSGLVRSTHERMDGEGYPDRARRTRTSRSGRASSAPARRSSR